MMLFEGENDKLVTELSAYKAMDEESKPVEPIIESNRNLHATNVLDFDSSANSKILPNAASPGYDINGVRKVGDIVGTGRGGGGGLFAHALGETTPKRWSLDLLFKGTAEFFADLDPSHTVVSLAVVATVIVVAVLTCLFKRKGNNRRKRTSGRGRKVGGGGELVASSSSPVVSIATRNIRECRLRTGTSRAEAPPASLGALPSPSGNLRRSIHTQKSPRRGPRGAYTGTVAPFGVDIRAAQTAEVERERNRVKKMNERRKAKKEAAATKEGSSATPSRGRQTQARSSNTKRNSRGMSPAVGKGKRKAPVQTPPTKSTSFSGKEESKEQKPARMPRAAPESPPRSTLVEHGSASRPTTPLKHGGLAVKSVAVASEELGYKTPERQLLTMPTRNNPRTPSMEQEPPESSNKGSVVRATVGGGGGTKAGVESSSRSTPSKRGASSVVETARREAQMETGSAAKARAKKLVGNGDDGHRRGTKRAKEEADEGDHNTKRVTKLTSVSTDAGQGNEGPRKSSRHSDKGAGDDSRSRGNAGGKTSTKGAERRTAEGDSKGKDDSGAKRGTKRGSISDETPGRYPKRTRKL